MKTCSYHTLHVLGKFPFWGTMTKSTIPNYNHGHITQCSWLLQKKVKVLRNRLYSPFEKKRKGEKKAIYSRLLIMLWYPRSMQPPPLSWGVVSHWERLAFYRSGLVVCAASSPDNFSHPLVHCENKTHWRDKDACAGEISARAGLRNT